MSEAAPDDEMTPSETTVMRMWTELLGSRPSSTHDDFFELGGVSLTLVQFMARVQETYGVELPVEILFAEGLTVAVAAQAIDQALVEVLGAAEVDGLLAELDRLSDEEVRALLAEGGNG